MVIVKLFGNKTIEITDTEARVVLQSVNAKTPFVMIDGNSIALSEIKGIYSREKWLELQAGDIVAGSEPPVPITEETGKINLDYLRQGREKAPLSEAGKRWLELLAANNTQLRKAGHYGTLQTLEDLDEFEKTGKIPDTKPTQRKPSSMQYRWKRKVVTDRQYHNAYASRPGYYVLETFGTDVVVAYRKAVPGAILGLMPELPAGEAWCNQSEQELLEARAGR
jgi:hypothetical protein